MGGVAGAPSDLYTLTPKSTFNPDLPVVKWQLVVEEPIASGGLNIARIALRDDPTRLNYFKGVRWTERAPEMVQTLMVESFENTGKIISVGRHALGLRSDFKADLGPGLAKIESPRHKATPGWNFSGFWGPLGAVPQSGTVPYSLVFTRNLALSLVYTARGNQWPST